jgi:hypothetical protein
VLASATSWAVLLVLLAVLVGPACRRLAAQSPVGSITITGGEQSSGGVLDAGTVTATVNGYSVSATYGPFSTPASIASALGALISQSCSSPVYAKASGATLNFYAKGSNVINSASITGASSDPSLFADGSFLENGLSGGTATCVNSGSISQGGSYCIAATNPITGNNPWMPALTYNGTGDSSPCNAYSYTLELNFVQPGDSYENGESWGFYNSQDQVGGLLGTAPWAVNWSLNEGDVGQYSEGGNGWINIYVNGQIYEGFAFNVWGQNPTTASITAQLNSLNPPWWCTGMR